MWGEIGFPGEDDVERDVPATMGGTLESCLLEDIEDRWRCRDEDIESDNAAFESLMRWNRDKAAEVFLLAAAESEESVGVRRSFFPSSILRNAEIFSSSVCTESAPPTSPSARTPEPGWTVEDVTLAFPLELFSSSVLLAPPDDGLPLLWLNELLYLEI